MAAKNKAGKLAYHSNPQEPVKATSQSLYYQYKSRLATTSKGKVSSDNEKEEALLLPRPIRKEKWYKALLTVGYVGTYHTLWVISYLLNTPFKIPFFPSICD